MTAGDVFDRIPWDVEAEHPLSGITRKRGFVYCKWASNKATKKRHSSDSSLVDALQTQPTMVISLCKGHS